MGINLTEIRERVIPFTRCGGIQEPYCEYMVCTTQKYNNVVFSL